MPIYSHIDILLHFFRFKNVDLALRGVYYLKARVHAFTANTVGGCLPYAIFSEPSDVSSSVRGRKINTPIEFLTVRQAELDAPTGAFCSRSFPIRFNEELVELNEGACFQCRVEATESDTLVVELELYHSPLEKGVGAPGSIHAYKMVAEQTLHIANSSLGVHEYFPCTFHEPYFSGCDLMVHTALVKISFWEPGRTQSSEGFRLLNLFGQAGHGASLTKHGLNTMSTQDFLLYCARVGKDRRLGMQEDLILADMADRTHQEYLAKLSQSLGEIRQAMTWLWDEVMSSEVKLALQKVARSPDSALNTSTAKAVGGELRANGNQHHDRARLSSLQLSEAFQTKGDPMLDGSLELSSAYGLYPPNILADVSLHDMNGWCGSDYLMPSDSEEEEVANADSMGKKKGFRFNDTLTAPSLQELKEVFSNEIQAPGKLCDRIDRIAPKVIADRIADELSRAGRRCFLGFSHLAALVPKCGPDITRAMYNKWVLRSKRTWAQQVMSQTVRFTTLLQPFSVETHARLAAEMRQNFSNKKVLQLPVYDRRSLNAGHIQSLPLAHLQKYHVGNDNSHVQNIRAAEEREAEDRKREADFLKAQADLASEDPFEGIKDFFRSLTPGRRRPSFEENFLAEQGRSKTAMLRQNSWKEATSRGNRSAAPQRARPRHKEADMLLQERMASAYARATARQAMQRQINMDPEDVMMTEFQKSIASIDALSYHPESSSGKLMDNEGIIGSADRDQFRPLPSMGSDEKFDLPAPGRRPSSRGRAKTGLSSGHSPQPSIDSTNSYDDALRMKSPPKRPPSRGWAKTGVYRSQDYTQSINNGGILGFDRMQSPTKRPSSRGRIKSGLYELSKKGHTATPSFESVDSFGSSTRGKMQSPQRLPPSLADIKGHNSESSFGSSEQSLPFGTRRNRGGLQSPEKRPMSRGKIKSTFNRRSPPQSLSHRLQSAATSPPPPPASNRYSPLPEPYRDMDNSSTNSTDYLTTDTSMQETLNSIESENQRRLAAGLSPSKRPSNHRGPKALSPQMRPKGPSGMMHKPQQVAPAKGRSMSPSGLQSVTNKIGRAGSPLRSGSQEKEKESHRLHISENGKPSRDRTSDEHATAPWRQSSSGSEDENLPTRHGTPTLPSSTIWDSTQMRFSSKLTVDTALHQVPSRRATPGRQQPSSSSEWDNKGFTRNETPRSQSQTRRRPDSRPKSRGRRDSRGRLSEDEQQRGERKGRVDGSKSPSHSMRDGSKSPSRSLSQTKRRPDSRPPSRGRDMKSRLSEEDAAQFKADLTSQSRAERLAPGGQGLPNWRDILQTDETGKEHEKDKDTSKKEQRSVSADVARADSGVPVIIHGRSLSAIPQRRPASRGWPKLDLRPASVSKADSTCRESSQMEDLVENNVIDFKVQEEVKEPQTKPVSEAVADDPDVNMEEHVIVLHHGLGGSSHDLRIIKNYVQVIFPDAKVMVSAANHFSKEDGIEKMGERLAEEVRTFILDKVPEMGHPTRPSGRLSFIGYSMGSLVIRAALVSRSLTLFLHRLHSFISLSSPHLGCPYSTSQVVKTGMWAIRKFMKVKVLEELELKDHESPTETYLYRLSLMPGLRYFKHLVLVSAHQDKYVPSYSARIQICDQAGSDFIQGPAVIDMAANLMSEVDPSRVMHMDLDNVFDSVNMNTMIGRAAHLSYLNSPQVINLLLFTFYDILK